ncbi:hypothetical protein B9Z55_018000 [Caenorhabditis nigoni]|uniref:Protein phosphatase 1 regulatory subunit 21 N-terminal domain-containing protein n=1 Tax=Caenorhabditis nigoni TaxID=1611254 RepID=A0A2G5TBT8_9PELO|nr:hypothetical protein B9Z55_018000 [Caenorhabditis nigoni]
MSVSSVSLSSDANVRYQRLAAEYTKLRAQAKVLREGVLEERGRVDKLTEDLKSKEAIIRRLQAENESLTFRNDQLVRRVENFQFEAPPTTLQTTTPRKPATTKQAPPTSQSNVDAARIELLEQELKQKLEQNERLVSELAENERQHAVEMAEMSEKLAKEMRKLEDEVKRMRIRTKMIQNPKEDVEEISSDDVEKKKALEISEDVVVEDIGSPEPPESQEEARIMVAEAARGTFSGFTNVFTLLQQRCEIYPFDIKLERLPSHVEKLSSEYAQTARLFSALVEIVDSIIQNSEFNPTEHIPEVVSKCRLISKHCSQMLAELVKQMTSEENRVTWCTTPLARLNNDWEELILKMFGIFEDVTEHLTSSEGFLESLDALDVVTSELVGVFKKRWIFEARLPTTTRRMRCVGSALEEALQMTSVETSKLAARARRVKGMEEDVRRRQDELEDVKEQEKKEEKEERIHVELSEVKKKSEPLNPFDEEDDDFKDASDEIQKTSEHLDVPTSSESTNRKTSSASSESKIRKTSNLETSTPSESKLPESSDSAHLESELRLLQIRNDELQKERDKMFVDISLTKRKLEKLQNSENPEKSISSDVDQIWEIGMERRDEWIQRVQKAEKALRFYEIEFDLLLRHEVSSEEHLREVLAEMESIVNRNARLEDELESVRRSYESQLGDLSEHLATLVKEREQEKESNKSRGSVSAFLQLKSFFNKS